MSLQINPKIQESLKYAELDGTNYSFVNGKIRFYSYEDARWFHQECDDCGISVKCNNFYSGKNSGISWDTGRIVFEFSQIKYAVFENNKPCTTKTLNEDFKSFGVDFTSEHGWDNNEFNTLKEAQDYANKWISPMSISNLILGTPQDYEYGHMIEIREIKI